MELYKPGAPLQELQTRIEKLQKAMRQKGISGSLIVQKTDLFYFAATSQQGWLYVPDSGLPLLLIFKEFDRARVESALERVISVLNPKQIPGILAEYGYPYPQILGLEMDVLPANLYFQYADIFKGSSITDISTEIRLIRAVKSAYEIAIIRQAVAFSDRLAARLPELLRPGKTEVELAGEIEGYARSLGHQGIVRMRLFGSELFYGHLLSGPAAAVPGYLASPTAGQGVSPLIGQGAGFKKIAKNEPVLFDYVFALQGYISDHARIFAIGSLPDDLMRAHEAMLFIQEEIKKQACTGAISGDIYEKMVSMAEEKGYGKFFMGAGERKIRFTGHGVGLELDEFPFLAKGQKLPLENGMIIALEPKVILPGKGVVGIENTFLVTDTGLESLSNLSDQITILPE
ncbi:MAG: Xaa-Pro peptidase family protein [Desulfocapsaceae bacterium]|nr:Xaa-Pro peptidase family protein [Desulfocapsaceae bacterium]